MQQVRVSPALPRMVLGMLFMLWACLGAWICVSTPFASGTDESIRYVAFAAAKNRWATEADYQRYGIDHYYYPPLYFLLFAPFYPDDPAFTDAFPWDEIGDRHYVPNGGLYIVDRDSPVGVPAQLDGLYRASKFVSLACGVVVLAGLATALALVFRGPARWWLVLGGTAPCLLLPQFLYYQTLCNNDALANALSALAVLAFVGAWSAALGRRRRSFAILSLASAAAIGLGILSKQSAVCLAPLIPSLAMLRYLDRDRPTSLGRVKGSIGFLFALCAATVACGGWWVILEAIKGDPSSLTPQLQAHPWAVRESGRLDLTFVATASVKLMRSYIALFTGDRFGVPDAVFLLYLAIPLVLVACLLVRVAVARRRSPPVTPQDSRRRMFSRVLWLALASTMFLNVALIIVYNQSVYAPYGRLLFPTLLASHLLLGQVIAVVGGDRTGAAAAVSTILTASLLSLFLWVFSERMIQAVVQPPERLVPISSNYSQSQRLALRSPVWEVSVSQMLSLPPGRLRGIRVNIVRSGIPQIGSVLNARLRLFDPLGRELVSAAFKPSAIGDNDATERWTDLWLDNAPVLSAPTMAELKIEASPPLFLSGLTEIRYAAVRTERLPGLLPVRVNGNQSDVSLCLTAVYSPL